MDTNELSDQQTQACCCEINEAEENVSLDLVPAAAAAAAAAAAPAA